MTISLPYIRTSVILAAVQGILATRYMLHITNLEAFRRFRRAIARLSPSQTLPKKEGSNKSTQWGSNPHKIIIAEDMMPNNHWTKHQNTNTTGCTMIIRRFPKLLVGHVTNWDRTQVRHWLALINDGNSNIWWYINLQRKYHALISKYMFSS